MANFFAELKRRHVYRVAAAYAVVAWVLLQIVNNIIPLMQAPVWTGQFCLLLLALGFPIAVFFAWMRELPASDTAAPVRTSVMDGALIGVLVIVIALISYQQFGAAPSRPSSLEAAREAAAKPAGISLAVLPFVNLSSDKEQEFFSDGMTEEITSALAKVADLRVVGRTSAFQFKGENKDLTAIGQALHATHLIEGSVRKDGNEVRITAQLIRADNGTHLWTESYDRELKGVFAVQEEIATAIATALRVPLGLKEGQSLVTNRTSDTDSYQNYLRARALVRGRGAPEPGGPLTEAVKLLEQATDRDPNYAPAWGLLGQAYALIPIFTAALANGSTDELRRIGAESLQKSDAAAQQAIRIDPNNIDGFIGLGFTEEARGRFSRAEDLYKQALLLDPGNSDALHRYGLTLSNVGRLKDSLALRLRLQAQEPLVPVYNWTTAGVLWLNARNDEAISILKAVPPTYLPRIVLAQVYASVGRYKEAASALGEIPSGIIPPEALTETIRLFSRAPAGATSPRTVPSKGLLGFVYLYAGTSDRGLDFYEGLADAGTPAMGSYPGSLWASAYAPVRKTERFKAYARKAGMLDYWKTRGWPDLCRPMGADDFVCD